MCILYVLNSFKHICDFFNTPYFPLLHVFKHEGELFGVNPLRELLNSANSGTFDLR